jgi:hypothetical protein
VLQAKVRSIDYVVLQAVVIKYDYDFQLFYVQGVDRFSCMLQLALHAENETQ